MSELSSGNESSEAQTNRWRPQHKYILDNSLSPAIATGLRALEWDIRAVHEIFHAKPTDSIKDQRIIPRAEKEGRAWVTLDLEARREHAGHLARHRISVLWVGQAKDGATAAYQFALLGMALLKFDRELSKNPGMCVHARIGPTEHAELELLEIAGRKVRRLR